MYMNFKLLKRDRDYYSLNGIALQMSALIAKSCSKLKRTLWHGLVHTPKLEFREG